MVLYPLLYFNSIKVQLKLPIIQKLTLSAVFQFHKGTIKTEESYSIGTEADFNFNSIKVQLKQKNGPQIIAAREFQFHKGIIDPLEDSIIIFTNKIGYNMDKQILGKERMSTDNFL